MTFDRFPFDIHNCPFQVSSYYGTEDTVNCTSKHDYEEERQRSLQYFITIDALPFKYRKYSVDNRRFTACGVNILLKRTKVQILFQVYLPSMLLAIVSWISFVIKPEVVPGRMGLLATIFLVLINIFNGVKSTAPVSRSLNALDLYLLVCIAQVFAALIEYAIILFIGKHGVKSIFIPNKKKRSSQHPAATIGKQKTEHGLDEFRIRIDSVSLIIFPIFFILFNIIYWNIYIQNLYL